MRLGVPGKLTKEVSCNSRWANSLYVKEGVHAMSLHVVDGICGKGQQRVVGVILLELDVLSIRPSPIDFHLRDWIIAPPTVGGHRSYGQCVAPVD